MMPGAPSTGVRGAGERQVGPRVDRGERGRGVEVVGERGPHGGEGAVRVGPAVAGHGRAPVLQARLGGVQALVGPVPVVAVAVREDGQADGHRVDALLAQAGDEHEVAERLAHLVPVEADHAGVQVHARAAALVEQPGVRRAHLVVRELQVGAAALDVEGQPEGVAGDDRALDVPARAAPAERAAVPGGLAGALHAPQERVERGALAGPLGVSPALRGQRAHGVVVEPATAPKSMSAVRSA